MHFHIIIEISGKNFHKFTKKFSRSISFLYTTHCQITMQAEDRGSHDVVADLYYKNEEDLNHKIYSTGLVVATVVF